MILSLKDQTKLSPALPLRRVAVFANSSLPLALVGIPAEREDGETVEVSVSIVNADAQPITAPCEKDGEAWRVAFAPSCFPTYGFVSKGVKVVAILKDKNDARLRSILGVGDLEILSDSAEAQPGDPSKSYQVKGADIYLKSEIVDTVQHYKKQALSFDAEMGAWGAEWTGDYILVNGDFVPVEEV